MDDGIGRPSHRHVDLDGVVERGRRQDPFGSEILPHHVDDAASGGAAHTRVAGIGGRDGRRARQRQTERLGDRHHGRCRAHDHAGSEGARDAPLHLAPLLLGDVAGALLHPVFPHVGARPEELSAPVAAQHRARRYVDRGYAHADGAHDQPRRGLVATTQQHRAIERMTAQQLFGLHGQEVPVEHGRRLDERLRQRHRRQFDRKAAGLQHTALDVLRACPQVGVTGVDLAPGVDDGDDRPPAPIVGIVAELTQPRTMTERAQIVDAEPTMAAQVFGTLTIHWGDPGWDCAL